MSKAHVGNVGGAARNWWTLRTPELGTFSGRTFNEVISKFDKAMQVKFPGETVDSFYVKHRSGGNIRRSKSHRNRLKEDGVIRRNPR